MDVLQRPTDMVPRFFLKGKSAPVLQLNGPQWGKCMNPSFVPFFPSNSSYSFGLVHLLPLFDCVTVCDCGQVTIHGSDNGERKTFQLQV